MTKILTIITLAGSLSALFVGCSNNAPTTNSTTATTTNTSSTTSHNSQTTNEDIPANVRAAFPEAQSITKQHKDLTAAQISSIEKETGDKVADADHHSYLAFSTSGGTRRQIGAATVVEAKGKELVIIYESRNGMPFVKEIRGEALPPSFLDQFKGKGHDDKLQFGGNIKAQGADEATARAATTAIYRDVLAMQALYGAAHTH